MRNSGRGDVIAGREPGGWTRSRRFAIKKFNSSFKVPANFPTMIDVRPLQLAGRLQRPAAWFVTRSWNAQPSLDRGLISPSPTLSSPHSGTVDSRSNATL